MMKLLPALAALISLPAYAGTESSAKINVVPEPQTRVYMDAEAAYGFEADYERGGSGSVWDASVSAGVIIPWADAPLPGRDLGTWQWRLGVNYHRFEFDQDTTLPLPDRLQGVSAVLALELRVNDNLAALLDIRPGVYFEDDFSGSAFDVPIRLGFGYRVSDTFSLVGMLRYRGFSENPVIGGIGFVWNITDRLTLSAIYPEPRLTYTASEELSFFAGMEFAGGVYRVNTDSTRGRASGALVDYSDRRASIGATWRRGNWRLEAAGGVSLEREFDYHKEGDRYETDGAAPYMKLSARWEF
jgi:hypothetical protein